MIPKPIYIYIYIYMCMQCFNLCWWVCVSASIRLVSVGKIVDTMPMIRIAPIITTSGANEGVQKTTEYLKPSPPVKCIERAVATTRQNHGTNAGLSVAVFLPWPLARFFYSTVERVLSGAPALNASKQSTYFGRRGILRAR